MDTTTTQQEILLVTGTRFSQRQICQLEDKPDLSTSSEIEKLEEACWNGVIADMLPEIVEKSASGKKLYLWQVKEAGHFLELEWGESPFLKENYFSIDPYCALESKLWS